MSRIFQWALITSLALCITRPLAAANIVAAEYFLNTDPGLGLATPLVISPAQSSVNLAVTVPGAALTGLSPGLHRIWIRVVDENGQWSESLARTFRIDGPVPPPEPLLTRNIVAAEYFFNTDPGLGLATPIAIMTGEVSVNPAVSIPGSALSGLSPGLHRVWMRVRDQNGQWSESLARTFRIDGPQAAPEPPPLAVARIEYRWYRNGSPVGVAVSLLPDAPAATITFNLLAGLQGLQDGLTYQLVATPYDTLNTAGFSVTKSVLIQTTDSDGDGLPDLWENNNGLNRNLASDAALDSDSDGLTNAQEFVAGTLPQQRDTSGDGLSDGFVASLGLDPRVARPGMRTTLLNGVPNELSLFSESQIRALAPTQPLIRRDTVTGKFTLRMALEQSTTLTSWSPMLFTNEESKIVNGQIEHTFDSPAPTRFFRVLSKE